MSLLSTTALLVFVWSLLSKNIVSGARCLACSRKDKLCVTEYQLPFLIDSGVCENVRAHSKTVLKLCRLYPEGYQLQCEMNNLSEVNCKLPCGAAVPGSNSVTSLNYPGESLLGLLIIAPFFALSNI